MLDLVRTTFDGTTLQIVPKAGTFLELTAEDALHLFRMLHDLLPAMGNAAPELERTADGADWRCPHCDLIVPASGGLTEYESHQAAQAADVDGDDVYVGQGDTERHTMVWLCGQCERVVRVPGEMSVDWS